MADDLRNWLAPLHDLIPRPAPGDETVVTYSDPPRRTRKTSPRVAEKQAPRPIASWTDHPDGARTFTMVHQEAAKEASPPASDNELDKWLLRHPEYARSPERH